ncbi:hypothetical protein EMIHUDRAFT_432999 [Emiliania huxleyi CCMP1516]|uniref:Glycosyltransferase 2-like domain-containing protein n=2 Tax=Emiliania huxleyi TaxID=2903 RepID=A0A0D3I791_EMIH1|nr:hypothetical protein EMIHUDRAFT_432999 [Emiliania huxleyi CCMP1516]EOD07126.1 hypothetical protein EMIHUDRAFT_432999 [Emiliania huxleyi CCMP1516]|eukprot:XP_005759555.1 hypothetical protein EMIHUDRAFT_432999 [Emiliania huxleyi CCMP1516]
MTADVSVVLPCAYEYEYAARTVRSVSAATPPEILREIVVVDDGSTPPLRIPEPARWKAFVVRLEKTGGLIRARIAGAAAATGAVIVFFDCHVRPMDGYWRGLLAPIEADYRVATVPTVTRLDAATWQPVGSPTRGGAKCYLTFDTDFKWTFDATDDVPIMSGGLVAISRRWWNETGGYDSSMLGWGGENIDLSLRIWRCGGAIKAAKESYVAHMYREPGKPKTAARFRVPKGAPTRNRATSARAHFGRLWAKTAAFPLFEAHRLAPPDTSNIERALASLRCQSFEWYLRRFAYIYRDAGVLPGSIFQLEGGGRTCLSSTTAEPVRGMGQAYPEALRALPCNATDPRQWWHESNRNETGRCCSGLRLWNAELCIQRAGRLQLCTAEGTNAAQHVRLTAAGRLRFTRFDDVCLDRSGRPASCAAAGSFRRRGRHAPLEFTLLSAELQRSFAGQRHGDRRRTPRQRPAGSTRSGGGHLIRDARLPAGTGREGVLRSVHQ